VVEHVSQRLDTCSPQLQVILSKEQDIAFTASYMEFLTILSLIFNAFFLYVSQSGFRTKQISTIATLATPARRALCGLLTNACWLRSCVVVARS